MKSRSKTNWNSLTERLITHLKTSLKEQKKFAAELNAAAVRELKERAKLKPSRRLKMDVCPE